MDEANVHIALLQETNWDDTIHSPGSLNLNKFTVYHKSRTNPARKPSVGGGVAILVQSHLRSAPCPDVEPSERCEAVFADISLGDRTITLGSVYITHDARGTGSARDLITFLPLISRTRAAICGDLNSHSLAWDLHRRYSCSRGRVLAPAVKSASYHIQHRPLGPLSISARVTPLHHQPCSCLTNTRF